MSLAGGLKSAQMVHFSCWKGVCGCMSDAVSVLCALCRCVLFQLEELIACVYAYACVSILCACVCVCVCACAWVCVCVWGSERENNGVFQVEGQLLSLLLSIQQSSSLWRGLREALFRCCRGVDAGWLDTSFQNHFLSKAQHMDDKLLYTSTTKVVGKKYKYILLLETIWELEIFLQKNVFFRHSLEPTKYTTAPFKAEHIKD